MQHSFTDVIETPDKVWDIWREGGEDGLRYDPEGKMTVAIAAASWLPFATHYLFPELRKIKGVDNLFTLSMQNNTASRTEIKKLYDFIGENESNIAEFHYKRGLLLFNAEFPEPFKRSVAAHNDHTLHLFACIYGSIAVDRFLVGKPINKNRQSIRMVFLCEFMFKLAFLLFTQDKPSREQFYRDNMGLVELSDEDHSLMEFYLSYGSIEEIVH